MTEPGRPAATTLEVWVQPRAGRDEVVGRHGDAVKVRITSPPVDGAANGALLRFLAKTLGIARSAVEIVGGHSGRRKRIRIVGLESAEVRKRLGL